MCPRVGGLRGSAWASVRYGRMKRAPVLSLVVAVAVAAGIQGREQNPAASFTVVEATIPQLREAGWAK